MNEEEKRTKKVIKELFLVMEMKVDFIIELSMQEKLKKNYGDLLCDLEALRNKYTKDD